MKTKDLGKAEADKLRAEAKTLLNNLFCSVLKIPLSKGNTFVSITGVDRIVDCIISCALLEITSIQK